MDDTASDRVRRCCPVLAVDTVDSDDFMPMVFPEDLAEDFRRLTAIVVVVFAVVLVWSCTGCVVD